MLKSNVPKMVTG